MVTKVRIRRFPWFITSEPVQTEDDRRRTHVCGDGAGLSEDDGQVEERRREEQTGGADQRVGSGCPRPQQPTDLHAAGHAQHACDAGDGPENQTVGGETASHMTISFSPVGMKMRKRCDWL